MPQHRLDARSFSFRRGALVGAALLATASLGGCGTPESAPDTATSIATVPAPASSPAVALASEATQRNTLGTAALPPPSAPDGTWYLAANGARQVLQVTANADRTRDATLADEATGALDHEAKIAFHRAIKDNCPGVTVISVMHDPVPPRAADGSECAFSVTTT